MCSSRKPLSTNVQEAADIVSLAHARDLKVGVGHQFRLCPSLIEARDRIAQGAIGPLRLVTGVLARPWLTTRGRRGDLRAARTESGRGAGSWPMPAIISSTPCSGRPDRSPRK